jgi:UDP:flavonoid glycosyltransferase YjiC (YdhE family)
MVCLPVTNDQPGIGQRVECFGAGKVIHPRRASAEQIRRTLTTVMQNPDFRNRAASLMRHMSQMNGVHLAANIIESAMGCRKAEQGLAVD